MIVKNVLLLYLLLFLVSCNHLPNRVEESSFWDDCDLVASTIVENGDTIIVCDLNKVFVHKVVPSSIFLDTVEYVVLEENSIDAIVGKRLSNVYVTENYMGFWAGSYYPFKLFRKNGEFVGSIGSIGHGRGEYVAIDAVCMDEENDRIYILPYSSSKIFVYNFNGEYLSDIKLFERTMYGSSICIDARNNKVLVTNSIVGNPNYFVWTQDCEGNLNKGIRAADFFENITESFDESTLTRFRTNHVELFRLGYKNSREYLYHYEMESNRLIPQFKVINADENISIMIHELPLHYIIEEVCSVGPNQDELKTRKFLVDKKSLRGCIVDGFQILDELVYNDYCLFTQMHGSEFAILEMSSVLEERINKIQKKTSNLLLLQKNVSEFRGNKDDECGLVFVGKFKQ